MSEKSTAAIKKIISRLKAGKIAPLVQAALIRPPAEWPSSKWTLANRMLAYLQADTLNCRGFRQWQEAGRQVQRGAQAAFIFAPIQKKVVDKKTQEEKMVTVGFKPVPVFGVRTTEGEAPVEDYTPRKLPALAPLADKLGIKVTYQPLPPDRLGDYDRKADRINLATQYPRTFYHELAHAIHNRVDGLKGSTAERETVAEFCGCVLMDLYEGTDSTGNAYLYILSYCNDPIAGIMKVMSTVEKIIAFIEANA